MTDPRVRGRQQFILLAVLFFAPLLAAIGLFFFAPQWQPEGHTNYGELISPARPLPDVALVDEQSAPLGEGALRGKWSFVYLGAASCDASCADKLYQIRQIRTLLNEKRLRVQRVYLAPSATALAAARAQLSADHPDLKFLVEADDGQVIASLFRAAAPQADALALYLVDPLGNLMMVYSAASESPGILKDIKRLLRVSQIG